MKISLCMIVKNEEEVLARCLDSAAALADEIIVVDTGSADATKAIARKYTDKVYDFPWKDDFAAARNFAFSKATGDYQLWLDADDVIPPESAALFPALKALLETESPDLVQCPYEVGAALSFYRERFLKRESEFLWQGRVHECIAPRGKVMRFRFAVRHLGSKKERGARNLDIYRRWAEEEPLSPRDKFYYGRELYYHRLYTEAIAVLNEMLAGEGWFVNKIEACKVLALCHAERGNHAEALLSLFSSFLYGEPRATVCCEIGRLFRAENHLREAAFWYERALECRDHAAEGDFEEPAARTITPLLELVCIYYALGEKDKAAACHKKTEELAPAHPSVVYNARFFHDVL